MTARAIRKNPLHFIADSAVRAALFSTALSVSVLPTLGSMDGYNATHGQIATKISAALLETPRSASAVTHEQMDNQGSQTVSQAMRYTPRRADRPVWRNPPL